MIREIVRGYCYIVVFLFAVASVGTCVSDAHADEPGRAWYSAFGKHCNHVPTVRCDVTVTKADCDRVQEAVALISNDTSTDIIKFGGTFDISAPGTVQQVKEHDEIFVVQGTKKEQAEQCASKMGCVHAMTQWNRKEGATCFEGVRITLVAQPGELTDGVQFHVIVHEFLHALGLNHNPFPMHESFINQYAPRVQKFRQRHLHDLDKMRVCMIYDCTPSYFFEGR